MGRSKLLRLSRPGERSGGRRSPGNHLRDRVEIACPHEALVLNCFISMLLLAGEFFLLQLRIRRHA